MTYLPIKPTLRYATGSVLRRLNARRHRLRTMGNGALRFCTVAAAESTPRDTLSAGDLCDRSDVVAPRNLPVTDEQGTWVGLVTLEEPLEIRAEQLSAIAQARPDRTAAGT